ncbi:MAG: asparagine synthase (glutamine-hydrolyzing), partial [Candidatus Kerfeldbacteria bacterium]|nr:asparagine synthase (glutamine-hydrolyzing) [Candidatus Kerfeldbacteria bacterium]
MCGIVAFTGERDDRLLARLTDAVAHRGPDDAGHAAFDACSLGHRRLSIIDLSSGHQPLSTPDGRFTIIYNGELYNYRELRAQLSGYRFRTRSDTEVILAAYATWGMDAVERFNGMWAFAIWDQRERTLFLSRDRYGIKPLYLTRNGERWVVASEVKAFLSLPGFRPRVDDQTLIETLTFRFPPGDATVFAGVRRLPPGTNALVRNGKMTQHRYFTPRWEYREQNEDDVQQQVTRLLDAAVERHLIADVPVGLFLSGGMDSSLLTAIVAAAHPTPKTFT